MNYSAMSDELMKISALKELVRIGLKDVPGTPRLFMRHRNLAERVAAGAKADALHQKFITDPIKRVAEKGISKLPSAKLQAGARKSVSMIADDPIGHGLAAMVPVPVLPHVGIEVLKKGIRRGVDAIDPVPASLAAMG